MRGLNCVVLLCTRVGEMLCVRCAHAHTAHAPTTPVVKVYDPTLLYREWATVNLDAAAEFASTITAVQMNALPPPPTHPLNTASASRGKPATPPPRRSQVIGMCARTSQLIVSDFEKARTFVKLDHVNICRVQRCIPNALQDAWSQLPVDTSVAVNYLGSSGELEVKEALSALLGLAAVGSEDVVLEELVHLGRWFQELVGAKAVNTRLEIMDQKLRCPLYHMDKVALRLSVSYVGPGTQFLPEEDVRRAAMVRVPTCVYICALRVCICVLVFVCVHLKMTCTKQAMVLILVFVLRVWMRSCSCVFGYVLAE